VLKRILYEVMNIYFETELYLLSCSTPKDPNFVRYRATSGFSFQLSGEKENLNEHSENKVAMQ
jgi:hypothetical protein